MLEVPVYNTKGEQVDTLELEDDAFGSCVNPDLLKQAVVMYHANSHQKTSETKGRSEVRGARRKLYRQKGTGMARRGQIRTGVVRGGGVIFSKQSGGRRLKMPRSMRKAALNSAMLAKILAGNLLLVDELSISQPRTKELASVLRNLEISRSCLLALGERDRNVYLSARNIPQLSVTTTAELNAYGVATKQKVLMTVDAIKALLGQQQEVAS
ncbi:MAG: 50S ribosomal protein L4 [Phycisphaerae bacterium]